MDEVYAGRDLSRRNVIGDDGPVYQDLEYSSPSSPVDTESPLGRPLSFTDVSGSSGRLALARRLSSLAQQLTDGDDINERILTGQVDQLEEAVRRTYGTGPGSSPRHTALGPRSHSDQGGALLRQAGPSNARTRFSGLLASQMPWRSEREWEEEERRDEPRLAVSINQKNKIITELTKLNKELSIVVENLKARQEESQHIHSLLIERAEHAARRIIFLQERMSYLERELEENDDELQHLRISLKAVEVQMPPHPDPDIQRCITMFKEDYKALKRKRASRNSYTGSSSLDNTLDNLTSSSPGDRTG